MTAPTAAIDPKLKQAVDEIGSALLSGTSSSATKGWGETSTDHTADAAIMAGPLLTAFQDAARSNPALASQKSISKPAPQLSDPSAVADPKFFGALVSVLAAAAPAVINALSKDYQPERPSLANVIQEVPAHRREDKGWVEFASQCLYTVANTAAQVLSGRKDFVNESELPKLTPPSGVDKGWLSDIGNFVVRAAPTVLRMLA